MKKIDIEALIYMFILNLKETKKREFSMEECEHNIVYIFDNEEDFKKYFINNDIDNISSEILGNCKMKTTKKGSIIALKGLCDNVIKSAKQRGENRTSLETKKLVYNNPLV